MLNFVQVQVPFDTYFKVEGIQEFHRAVTMETFMKELAPSVWPKGERICEYLITKARLSFTH